MIMFFIFSIFVLGLVSPSFSQRILFFILSCYLVDFSLEPTKSAILPELVDLSNDEESCVRLAALETIVSLLSLLDDGKSCIVCMGWL